MSCLPWKSFVQSWVVSIYLIIKSEQFIIPSYDIIRFSFLSFTPFFTESLPLLWYVIP